MEEFSTKSFSYFYFMTSSEKEIFTLKQVANSIQKTLQERYNRTYWVKAEMHKLNYTMKGHCYPELVYKENDIIVAEMRGQIWKSNFERIMDTFSKEVKEPIQDGMLLLFEVKIVYHPVYGLSLDIIDIDPSFTLGELHKEREETIKRLEKEGLFYKNHQVSFPLLPQRIAVISVESSKGLSDFYSVTKSNPWGYAFFFMLFQAQLNGDGAVNSIIAQLKRIEKVKTHFDAVVIVRGGGGEIGLSCYNNYELSKAIATFSLPILTGIGHSTNVTVAELVAHRSAITPTELGEFLIQQFHNFSVPIKDAIKTIKNKAQATFRFSKELFQSELKMFRQVSINRFMIERNTLKDLSQIVSSEAQGRLKLQHKEVYRFSELMKIQVENFTRKEEVQLNFLQKQLSNWSVNQKPFLTSKVNQLQQQLIFNTKNRFKLELQKINEKAQIVSILDPKNILKRGYVIPIYQGKILEETNLPDVNAEIDLIMHSHILKTKLINIQKNDD
jgi:exodeoxyribonuclease VII large subunit